MGPSRRAAAAVAALLAAGALAACGGDDEDGVETPINTEAAPIDPDRTPAPNEPREDFGPEE